LLGREACFCISWFMPACSIPQTRQDSIEIAEFLIERVLGPTLDRPSFISEERHKLILDRFYTVTLTALLA
jgi:hypothetical protein